MANWLAISSSATASCLCSATFASATCFARSLRFSAYSFSISKVIASMSTVASATCFARSLRFSAYSFSMSTVALYTSSSASSWSCSCSDTGFSSCIASSAPLSSSRSFLTSSTRSDSSCFWRSVSFSEFSWLATMLPYSYSRSLITASISVAVFPLAVNIPFDSVISRTYASMCALIISCWSTSRPSATAIARDFSIALSRSAITCL